MEQALFEPQGCEVGEVLIAERLQATGQEMKCPTHRDTDDMPKRIDKIHREARERVRQVCGDLSAAAGSKATQETEKALRADKSHNELMIDMVAARLGGGGKGRAMKLAEASFRFRPPPIPPRPRDRSSLSKSRLSAGRSARLPASPR